MKLVKYHGLGNDYLVLDPAHNPPVGENRLPLTPGRVRLICDRNLGAGSDGILLGPLEGPDGKTSVRIFNPDGSEAEKSGNGTRIFFQYLRDAGYATTESFLLSTLGGEVGVRFLSEKGADLPMLRVDMGHVTFTSDEIPVSGPRREVVNEEMSFGGESLAATCLSIGNPHCVLPVDRATKARAEALGPLVENAPRFPNRINMQLLEVLDRETIRIEIYERGAGYTLASGSSSCAAASAARRLGLVGPRVKVRMPGGELLIEIADDWSVRMTGPVERVGTVALSDAFVRKLAAEEDAPL